jgi:septum site-determining protein MinC
MTTGTTVDASEPNSIITAKAHGPCLKLKASLLPMTVLELHHYETDQIDNELRDKTRQAPDFFENLPVVIDLEKFDPEAVIPFKALVAQCLSFSIKVVAVRGGHPAQQLAAKEAGLGVLARQKDRSSENNEDESPAEPMSNGRQASLFNDPAVPGDTRIETVEVVKEVVKTVVQTQRQQSKIVHQPIRSGQQVYAADGDLIIMASVSAGAEILADGNIHVYGTLRGRALAGVKGDTRARIFCYSLEAELVSIAGQYKISEDIDKSKLKKPTQIFLDNDALCFKEIEF